MAGGRATRQETGSRWGVWCPIKLGWEWASRVLARTQLRRKSWTRTISRGPAQAKALSFRLRCQQQQHRH